MAGTIKGITLEIGGTTTKLTQALKAPQKECMTLQAKLKDVNKSLKLLIELFLEIFFQS